MIKQLKLNNDKVTKKVTRKCNSINKYIKKSNHSGSKPNDISK